MPNQELITMDKVFNSLADSIDASRLNEYYKYHPREYLKLVVNEPWYRQVDIFESVRNNVMTLIRSCNDVGKTLSVSVLVLWLLDCWRPYVKVISTAQNYKHLQYTLWTRIRSAYQSLKPRFNYAQINYLDFKPDPVNHPEWFAVGYNPEIKGDEAEAFQGHHAPPAPPGAESLCVFLIDEAISTHPAILKAIEGSLFSEGTKLVALYNPTDPTSLMKNYESDPRANVIQISHDMFFNSPEYKAHPEYYSELADPAKSKQFVKIYGEHSPIVMARVKGEWCTDSELVAVKYTTCVDIKEQYKTLRRSNRLSLKKLTEVKPDSNEFTLGKLQRVIFSWDVAGEGSDLNVLRALYCGDKGLLCKKLRQWSSEHADSLTYVYEQIINHYNKLNKIDIHLIVDTIGEGSHVPSIMTKWLPDEVDNIIVIGFKAGSKASTIKERKEIKILNKISEAWLRTALLMEQDIDEWLPIVIEMDNNLTNQLTTRRKFWKMKNNEPLVWYIESKDKWKSLNRQTSPDDADALVMAIWGYFHTSVARFEAI